MQSTTKIKKRQAVKTNQELQVLNCLRANPDLADAITAYLVSPSISIRQRERLRATLAVLSHAPINKKLLASL